MVNDSTSPEPPAGDHVAGDIVRARLAQQPRPYSADPSAGDSSTGLFQRVVHSRAAVLAILFFATGCLGLPLLWMNPNFTRLQRWLLAIVVTLYTAALIALTCWIVVWSWSRISSSF